MAIIYQITARSNKLNCYNLQQTPVLVAGTKEQQKKYLGRLIEEPLVAVRN